MKIASNGKYLIAPTLNGKLFFFDILSGKVLKILNDHDGKNNRKSHFEFEISVRLIHTPHFLGLEVRDIKLNPFKKQLFTCADDGNVKVYQQTRISS